MNKKNQNPSIDGFALRRRKPAGEKAKNIGISNVASNRNPLHTAASSKKTTLASGTAEGKSKAKSSGVYRDEVEEVLGDLKGIDEDLNQSKKPLLTRRKKIKKNLKRTGLVIGVLILLIGAFIGIKAFLAGGRVFDGNLFTALFNDGKELRTDKNGRVNVLMFGTSEDDPGHDGADLTDSIMVASIKPDGTDGFMFSVPRDLWVKYGEACLTGYEGKINVAYQCGGGSDGDFSGGASKLEGIIEDNFGIDIQYHVGVNYTALRDTVNAVGGITVEIDSDDPRGVLDRNFDWQCGYECYLVKWPNGPAKLNGDQALALARARNAAGGYGLSGSNFDREVYQQKIITAILRKAASAGTLANPVSVTRLIDSMGNNVRSNFDAGEIKTLISLAQKVDASKLKSIILVDKDEPLVTTGMFNGESIVRPVAGMYDFSRIQSTLKAYLSNDTALLERALIDILNGSGEAGAASQKADVLTDSGFAVNVIGNAPATDYQGVSLYDVSGENPATRAKLEETLSVKTLAANDLPAGVLTDADFVIILGSNGLN